MKKRIQVIENGKYNRSAIMRKAWAYLKNEVCFSLGSALSQAWEYAKSKMNEYICEERMKSYQAMSKNRPVDYNPYNDKNIDSSAFYSGSKGYMGAHFCND